MTVSHHDLSETAKKTTHRSRLDIASVGVLGGGWNDCCPYNFKMLVTIFSVGLEETRAR